MTLFLPAILYEYYNLNVMCNNFLKLSRKFEKNCKKDLPEIAICVSKKIKMKATATRENFFNFK